MQERIAQIKAEQARKLLEKNKIVEGKSEKIAESDAEIKVIVGLTGAQMEAAIQQPKVIDIAKATTLFAGVPSMMEVDDIDEEHVILYGPPKTGKTLAFGLLAEFFNLLVFDGDKGLKALYDNLPKEMLKRIIPIRMVDTPDYPLFFRGMLKVVTGRKITLCLEHGIHECPICNKNTEAKSIQVELEALPSNWVVGMDSQTQFVNSAIRHITLQVHTDAKTGKLKEIPYEYKFERDQWMALKNIMDTFGSYVKDLRCPFVSISHETMVETEAGEKQLAPVSGSDNSSRGYAKFYGSVVFTRVVNGKHTYSSASTFNPKIQAGSRSNIALEKQGVPALLHLFRPKDAAELLKGSWTEWYLNGKSGVEPKVKDVLPAD